MATATTAKKKKTPTKKKKSTRVKPKLKTTSTTVAIIGSGFGGQCAAVNLRKIGVEDFRILERRDFMGGTWCQNSYPGAAVDVQSPLYSFSFEPYDWSQMYAEQDELERYTNYVIDKHRLREKTDLNTNVEHVSWHERDQCWEIRTNHTLYRAKFLINASGPLSTAVIPDFKDKESFGGASFHTNDWNHDINYRGKRVAVVGSGASAAQVIPAIAEDVAELHVFQRTPHWVLPRPDRTFSKSERALLRKKPFYYALRNSIYWTLETRVLGMKYSEQAMKLLPQKQALAFLKKQVSDPVKRKKLTPDYTIGCKRIVLSSTLLPAVDLPSTTLYGKDEGIAEINRKGIKTADGRQVDLDVIVYATGYDPGAISYPVTGRGGATVGEFWHDYPRAYLGTSVPGFPNFFVITGPNTGIGHTSALFIIESQMNYIMDAIKNVQKKNLETIEVKPEAEEEYTTMIHSEMKGTVWEAGGCNSWYKNESGKVIAMFPGFSFTYHNMTRKIDPKHHILR